jgi:putative endonuclease
MKARLLGALGESLAADYYRKNGYMLCTANYRTRQGEIDLIVRKGDLLVFVEVKTRSAEAIDTPGASVTTAKQRRIVLAAKQYLAALGTPEPYVRFDVMEIMRMADGSTKLHCIEDAFTC